MSMSRNDSADDTVRKRSGWLIPLAVLAVTVVLSAFFLLYYLFPAPPPLFAEQQSPTSDTTVVALDVNGLKLWIPSNYIEFESARHGGPRREVALFALLPDLTGWSNWNSGDFDDNAPKSAVIYMPIREDRVNLSEAERMERIYLAYVTNPKGEPASYGLTKYTFQNDSGYRSEDLFAAQTGHGVMLLHCAKLGPDVPSPNCWRDLTLAKGVAVSYRFKRARLNHWREIGDGVEKLMDSFKHKPK
jgi:hypothetical protein